MNVIRVEDHPLSPNLLGERVGERGSFSGVTRKSPPLPASGARGHDFRIHAIAL